MIEISRKDGKAEIVVSGWLLAKDWIDEFKECLDSDTFDRVIITEEYDDGENPAIEADAYLTACETYDMVNNSDIELVEQSLTMYVDYGNKVSLSLDYDKLDEEAQAYLDDDDDYPFI